jgi:hypothetical protein
MRFRVSTRPKVVYHFGATHIADCGPIARVKFEAELMQLWPPVKTFPTVDELVIIPEDVSGITGIVGCYPGLSSNLTKYGSNRDNSYPGYYSLVSPLLGGGQ